MKKTIYLIFFIISYISFIIYSDVQREISCKEISNKRINFINQVSKKKFDELIIFSISEDKINLVKIKNSKIVKLFRRILKNKTVITDDEYNRFNRVSFISIKTGKIFYTITIRDLPDNSDKNIAHIEFFDKPWFNIEEYYNLKSNISDNDLVDLILNEREHVSGCDRIKNNSIYDFMQKYFYKYIDVKEKRSAGVIIKSRKLNF